MGNTFGPKGFGKGCKTPSAGQDRPCRKVKLHAGAPYFIGLLTSSFRPLQYAGTRGFALSNQGCPGASRCSTAPNAGGTSMSKRHHTVIFVPHAHTKLRKWRISNLQIGVAVGAVVLLTVAILHGNAYGIAIKEDIEIRLKRSVSVGALRTALRRRLNPTYDSLRP